MTPFLKSLEVSGQIYWVGTSVLDLFVGAPHVPALNAFLADLHAYRADTRLTVQFTTLDHVLSFEHAYLACYHALRAEATGNRISKQLSVEILLYLSTQRQISLALQDFGLQDPLDQRPALGIIMGETRASVKEFFAHARATWGARERPNFDFSSPERVQRVAKYFEVSEDTLCLIQDHIPDRSTTHAALGEILLERMASLALNT